MSNLRIRFPLRIGPSLIPLLLLWACSFGEVPPTETPVTIATAPSTLTPTPAPPSPTATLSPTAPPLPSPTPSPPTIANLRREDRLVLPSPTPEPEGIACVIASPALNLREGPATGYQVIETLSSGSSISALKGNAEGSWLLVETSQHEIGWIKADLVTCQGELASLPQAEGLPPPPVQAAAQLSLAEPSPTLVPLPPTETPAPPTPVAPPVGRWRGEYYDNASLLGDPVLIREDGEIDFNWILDSPAPGIPADNFSVRWTGIFNFEEAGDYRFFAGVDDGVRLYLDGWLVIDAWHTALPVDYSGTFSDIQPGLHTLVVEYFESGGHARIKVWSEHGQFTTGNWAGEYYNTSNLQGPVIFNRASDEIDFDWGDGSPDGQLSRHHFSVRWRRTLYFEYGDYRFFAELEEEDRVRVKVDGWVVIDEDREDGGTSQGRFEKMGGGNHTVEVEYEEYGGEAAIKFWWERD